MGRLGGFSYRDVVKRLKEFGLNFTDRPPGAMKFGILLQQTAIPQSPITQEICLKEP